MNKDEITMKQDEITMKQDEIRWNRMKYDEKGWNTMKQEELLWIEDEMRMKRGRAEDKHKMICVEHRKTRE
jgi:hypothetical protein